MIVQVKHKGVPETAPLAQQYSYFLAPQASSKPLLLLLLALPVLLPVLLLWLLSPWLPMSPLATAQLSAHLATA